MHCAERPRIIQEKEAGILCFYRVVYDEDRSRAVLNRELDQIRFVYA